MRSKWWVVVAVIVVVLLATYLAAGWYFSGEASPEAAIAAAQMPILLIHSRTDNFTPFTHSEAIYANSDQSRTVLHVNDWGSPHAADIATDFAAYEALFNAFLAQYVPDFGQPGE